MEGKRKYRKGHGKGKTPWDEGYFAAVQRREMWREPSGKAGGVKKYPVKETTEVGFNQGPFDVL